MEVLRLAPLFALAGCSLPSGNSFTVADENAVLRSAQLVLCSTTIPLERHDGRFTATRQIDCEGSGYILLTEASGEQRQCVVGYVTPGAKQEFTFQESECQKRGE